MAGTKKSLGTVIILVLVLLLLYALNPTTADFQAWRSSQAKSEAGGGSGLAGVMKKGAGAIAGAMTGLVAGGYQRKDYLVCSTYALGGDLYLGAARLFIKLK